MNQGAFQASERGTQQGGVISPLLANIAFHGMASAVGVTHKKHGSSHSINSKRALVRYADAFVVFTETGENARAAKKTIASWLADIGDRNTGLHLPRLLWTPIRRHIMVTYDASPDDPARRTYWEQREAEKGKSPCNQTATVQVAKRQKGLCVICNDSLHNGEELHVRPEVA
ncbi:hypothetical protein NKDENANG_04169 [Candidatus Entotheonellaceae bacterium PAL068K]